MHFSAISQIVARSSAGLVGGSGECFTLPSFEKSAVQFTRKYINPFPQMTSTFTLGVRLIASQQRKMQKIMSFLFNRLLAVL